MRPTCRRRRTATRPRGLGQRSDGDGAGLGVEHGVGHVGRDGRHAPRRRAGSRAPPARGGPRRSAWRIPTTCSGVLPAPYTTSGSRSGPRGRCRAGRSRGRGSASASGRARPRIYPPRGTACRARRAGATPRLIGMPGVPPARYAYLGPEGTFTEQALRSLPAAARAELQPCSTVTLALDAVRGGEADGAVVPIENSVEGSVPVTLDELATGEPLMITREMTVPIAFSLLARPGTTPDDSHAGWRPTRTPRRRCRRWLAAAPAGRSRWCTPRRRRRRRSCSPATTPTGTAAISAPVAAEHYRLATLADGDRRQPGRADPVRAGLPAGLAAAAHRAATRRRWWRSCATTTPARCWRSSSSSPCGA